MFITKPYSCFNKSITILYNEYIRKTYIFILMTVFTYIVIIGNV